jgi:hypothetical protein
MPAQAKKLLIPSWAKSEALSPKQPEQKGLEAWFEQ